MNCALSMRQAGMVAVLVLTAAGCNTKVYQIELEPKGDKIERRLTVSFNERFLGETERSELGRIARLYGAAPPQLPVKRATFRGTFTDSLPNDVGGDGHFVNCDSPFGRVCVYVERFRGNDDVHASLEERHQAVDQLVDLLLGWFESELHAAPEWPALRSFLDKSLRGDAQNLSLDEWALTIGFSESKNLIAEVGFRTVQYFVERGYFTYQEAPRLGRALTDALERQDFAPLLSKIRRLLISHAGRAADGPPTDAFGFLSDSQRAIASWHRYFEQTAYFKQHRDRVGRQNRDAQKTAAGVQATPVASDRASAKPTPAAKAHAESASADDALFDLCRIAFPILDLHLFGEAHQLELSIKAPREPFWTNGKWAAGDRRIVWSNAIVAPDESGARPWPRLCFAAWDEPNEEAQKQLLGSPRVTAESLFAYCFWYQGLTAQERQEWDTFLRTATKENRLLDRLDDFRFSNETAGHRGMERVAAPGADVISNVLTPRKPST